MPSSPGCFVNPRYLQWRSSSSPATTKPVWGGIKSTMCSITAAISHIPTLVTRNDCNIICHSHFQGYHHEEAKLSYSNLLLLTLIVSSKPGTRSQCHEILPNATFRVGKRVLTQCVETRRIPCCTFCLSLEGHLGCTSINCRCRCIHENSRQRI